MCRSGRSSRTGPLVRDRSALLTIANEPRLLGIVAFSVVPFRLIEDIPCVSQGSILCIARAFESRLRWVRVACQLRPPHEEDLHEILAEVLPDLCPVCGLQSYYHCGVHADGFGQLILRHEHPLPRSRQLRPVYLHYHTPRSVSSVWSTTAVIGSDRHIPRSWKTSPSHPYGAILPKCRLEVVLEADATDPI